MSRDEIIRMAREADLIDFRDADDDPHTEQMVEFLERFAALVAAQEREACATECESLSHRTRWVRAGINGVPMEPCQYAAAIRARLEGKP